MSLRTFLCRTFHGGLALRLERDGLRCYSCATWHPDLRSAGTLREFDGYRVLADDPQTRSRLVDAERDRAREYVVEGWRVVRGGHLVEEEDEHGRPCLRVVGGTVLKQWGHPPRRLAVVAGGKTDGEALTSRIR